MKPWYADVERHIAMWSARPGHPTWWPRFVYHFTDVRNAAAILQNDCLYSRAEASRLGLMQVDNASAEIIGQTRPEHLEFVRLYFRPRTPTQYRNEGIRPGGRRELSAHCPVPVYFCFDALGVLSRMRLNIPMVTWLARVCNTVVTAYSSSVSRSTWYFTKVRSEQMRIRQRLSFGVTLRCLYPDVCRLSQRSSSSFVGLLLNDKPLSNCYPRNCEDAGHRRSVWRIKDCFTASGLMLST